MNIFATGASAEVVYMEFMMISTGRVQYELIEEFFWLNWG